MSEPHSYEEVARLVSDISIDEGWAQVTFVSDCGESVRTVPVSLPGTPTRSNPRSLRHWVYGRLKGIVRSQAGDSLPPGERQRIVMSAFASFLPTVKRDDDRWVRRHNEAHPTELFDKLVREAPIHDAYELEVFRRVLFEVSAADGVQQKEERVFLEELFGSVWTEPDALPWRPVTVAELAEVRSLPVRRIVLLLCWAMAYADGLLEPEESAALWKVSRGFQLPDGEVRKLQNGAKLFLLDRAYAEAVGERSTTDGEAFRQRVRRLGFANEELQRLSAWYPLLPALLEGR